MVTDEPYLLLLTAAQIILVPLMLQQIIQINKTLVLFTWVTMFSVFFLQLASSSVGQTVLAFIYLVFTFLVALYGLKRFLYRGFTNWAEISIDFGMLYLFVGGLWFFAYITGINTGFSPLITWLTAIHFHYSAFLLPISLGFLGRVHEWSWFRWIVPIILGAPMLVAIGMTFWPILEVISVLLYILAIYSLIILVFRTRFPSRLQAFMIRVSYCSLGVTILFSLLYALNRSFGYWYISIDFMLKFHGFINCFFFGVFGVVGWAVSPPVSKHDGWKFPVSRIRGNLNETGHKHPGLVDDLNDFVNVEYLPDTIVHFYEHTEEYKLFASVKWATWFKPLAVVYKLISNKVQQLNLPLSSKNTEMTGEILTVDPIIDGRQNPRAWIRKVKGSIVFVAIYSQHKSKGKTYMNISLPLPYSSMVGVLQLDAQNDSLILKSEGEEEGDAGIYLTVGKAIFKLPLSEHFLIQETEAGSLTAQHKMRILGVPFLHIHYLIQHRV
ncbi:YndJ family protein [Sediminibacillus albus]|nr:YndJ family protein [Sediminibacillus albus]